MSRIGKNIFSCQYDSVVNHARVSRLFTIRSIIGFTYFCYNKKKFNRFISFYTLSLHVVL